MISAQVDSSVITSFDERRAPETMDEVMAEEFYLDEENDEDEDEDPAYDEDEEGESGEESEPDSDDEDLELKKDNIRTHLDAENLACVQIEVMLRKALAEGKNEYSALQYSIRGQLNSGEGWSEAGYDVEYAPRIRVAS